MTISIKLRCYLTEVCYLIFSVFIMLFACIFSGIFTFIRIIDQAIRAVIIFIICKTVMRCKPKQLCKSIKPRRKEECKRVKECEPSKRTKNRRCEDWIESNSLHFRHKVSKEYLNKLLLVLFMLSRVRIKSYTSINGLISLPWLK